MRRRLCPAPHVPAGLERVIGLAEMQPGGSCRFCIEKRIGFFDKVTIVPAKRRVNGDVGGERTLVQQTVRREQARQRMADQNLDLLVFTGAKKPDHPGGVAEMGVGIEQDQDRIMFIDIKFVVFVGRGEVDEQRSFLAKNSRVQRIFFFDCYRAGRLRPGLPWQCQQKQDYP